jgi:hypothetical protein
MTPHCVVVSPIVQLQVEPGSTPAASTSATSEATGAVVEAIAAGVDAGTGVTAVGNVVVVVDVGAVVVVEAVARGVKACGARSAGLLCTATAALAGGVEARTACVSPDRLSDPAATVGRITATTTTIQRHRWARTADGIQLSPPSRQPP